MKRFIYLLMIVVALTGCAAVPQRTGVRIGAAIGVALVAGYAMQHQAAMPTITGEAPRLCWQNWSVCK